MVDNAVAKDKSLLDQGLDALETGLRTFGGPQGMIAAEVLDVAEEALEDIRFLFDEGIEASVEKGLDEIPPAIQKFSGGAISAAAAKKYMSEFLKNDTVKSIVDTISDTISKLVDKLIDFIQKGEDWSVEKLSTFLDHLGSLADPLKNLVKQIDQAIDKSLDSAKKAVDGMTQSVNAGIDKFISAKDKGEIKSLKQLENSAKAAEQLGEVAHNISSPGKAQNADVLQEATKIIQQSALRLDANKIDSPNSKEPEQKGVVEEKSTGVSR